MAPFFYFLTSKLIGGLRVFYSHPDKRLIEHLKEVYEISQEKINDGDLKKCFKIIAYTHDFGKFTTYFQKYLETKKEGKYAKHGFISALFAAFCSLKEFGTESFLPLISYSVVLHHHGDLENVDNHLPISTRGIMNSDYKLADKIEIFEVQRNDIIKNKDSIIEEYKTIDEQEEYKINFVEYIQKFLECDIVEVLKMLKQIKIKLEKEKSDDVFFIHQLLYSALISADKLSASGTIIPNEAFASFAELNRGREVMIKTAINNLGINEIRDEIFERIQKNLEKYYNKSRIFTITAPTGTGKTFAGFFAAVKLRELLGGNRRIVYSLPFTSIIDQNYETIYQIHKVLKNFERESSKYIIKHHSLVKPEYIENEYKYDLLESELLIENWSSGIIVTTFVQLFETLISTRNRMLKKLINIKDSIIILDEIQAIDISLLPLIEYVLEKATELYDLRIILMTATKPYIFKDSLELLDNNEKYFSIFNRTTLLPNLSSRKLEDFIKELKENLQDKSYLIVCNTINSSLEVYENLKGINRPVFYLSTNLLPIHRLEKIKKIKELLSKGEKIILVSTQVVEAGVDIDFDVVIRDIGPLDSIIQCAGRCNRNSLKENGKVYVYSLVPNESSDELNYGYGRYIYGLTTLQETKKILQKSEKYSEKDYFCLISEYFKSIQENLSKKRSENLIKSIKTLNFSEDKSENITPISDFSIIENKPNFVDVFVMCDDISEEGFKRFCDIIKLKDYYEKREKYLEIKPIISNYTISVPMEYHSTFVEQFGLYIIPREIVNDYYDYETGFKRHKKSYDII